ncbi:hypothetical protein [Kribbella solani]|uniref:Uncharacterized protein n=1 Tax=Kribbella solani TaxID=236067 RepID=A0A841DI21_9ACTN|nr:hypothetical protein [Kribbella solani]MBB5977149.1 hypothetical protein [Kribbella solani]
MNMNRKTVYSVAILVPFAAAVIWVLTRLGWIGAVLSVVAVIVGVVAYRRTGVPTPPAEEVPEVSQLSTSGLPTADETVFLELSATVHWQAAKPESYHADVAREFVLRRAREVTSRWQPAQYALAQHELAAAIGRPESDGTGELEVWASELRLQLPEAVQHHLAKLDEAHRAGLLWEVGASNQSKVRAHLRDDALRTPASAIVWWLAQNEGSVQQAVDLAGVLTRLSQLATGQSTTDDAAQVQVMIDAIEKLDDDARRPAAHDLADAFGQAGLDDLARRLRDHYQLPALHSVVDRPESPAGGMASAEPGW